ncbi:CatB-related O-acetyltransferase [Novosphingobium rosa]|uniref:CatB-related O-acetyltransferase n=1 Tax=Novosphingobium rosa TaxID=76978 RepID=UPI000B30EA09|nr:CatB-related O-acetyltransferase [Novosphingobium rosa]
MSRIRRLIDRLRGRHSPMDEFTSLALREKFRAQGVEVGLYSYGCFDLGRVPAGVTVGRYCSFAPTAQIFLRNHGVEFLGLTAYLYNQHLGVVEDNKIPHVTLTVGDDVWMGHNCIILPQVGSIGRGAVIAAGAVVTRAVPPYAVVAGNPARVVRMRFDEATIAAIEDTRWWELDTEGLRQLMQDKPELVFTPHEHFAQP